MERPRPSTPPPLSHISSFLMPPCRVTVAGWARPPLSRGLSRGRIDQRSDRARAGRSTVPDPRLGQNPPARVPPARLRERGSRSASDPRRLRMVSSLVCIDAAQRAASASRPGSRSASGRIPVRGPGRGWSCVGHRGGGGPGRAQVAASACTADGRQGAVCACPSAGTREPPPPLPPWLIRPARDDSERTRTL